MDPKKMLQDKKILIVDDEVDILEFLGEILDMCDIDKASEFHEAKNLLESNSYDVTILDIMGVRGYELLEIAQARDIPALMLTAHAISKENLKKSVEKGASYYVPKDEINNIDIYLSDILEAREKGKNVWIKWYERMSGFCNRRFGPDWRDEEPEFWDVYLKNDS